MGAFNGLNFYQQQDKLSSPRKETVNTENTFYVWIPSQQVVQMNALVIAALAFAFLSSLFVFVGNVMLDAKHAVLMRFVFRIMLLSFLALGFAVIWSLS